MHSSLALGKSDDVGVDGTLGVIDGIGGFVGATVTAFAQETEMMARSKTVTSVFVFIYTLIGKGTTQPTD